MEKSGHRSIEGVRMYEWTNVLLKLQTCKALETGQKKQPDPSTQLATITNNQSLPPPPIQPGPGFSGCTFNDCIFQIAPPPANQRIVPAALQLDEELAGIDIKELFDF